MARKFDVAVMHDFFVDRLVYVKSFSGMMETVSKKIGEGGGGLHGIRQEEIRGGNAVNLAHALSRLGLRTLLITHSDRIHESLLRQSFEGLNVDLRIKPAPAGLTVAFEEKVNVMLGDVGGASNFGPSDLEEEDWEALENAKVVCSVNWAANKKGTNLLVALRRKLGKEKTVFFDPADFRDRVPQFGALLELIARRGIVDWISMNQQEGMASADALGVGASELGTMCKNLAKRLRVVFDLHADGKSYSSEGTSIAGVAVDRVRPRRLTGVGDVWDAGAIFGRLKGMDELQRLKFANTAAKLYVEGEEPLPPTLEQVRRARGC